MLKIETENQKYLNCHLLFNTFLVYFNPVVHIFTLTENPCAPYFISSLYFNCENSFDNAHSLGDKIVFLIFEYYIAKWQYAVSFMWSSLCMGTDIFRVEYSCCAAFIWNYHILAFRIHRNRNVSTLCYSMWLWSVGTTINRREREMTKRKYLHKSCKLQKCRSGIFARFDKLVLLATVNICVTLTVNLLMFDKS